MRTRILIAAAVVGVVLAPVVAIAAELDRESLLGLWLSLVLPSLALMLIVRTDVPFRVVAALAAVIELAAAILVPLLAPFGLAHAVTVFTRPSEPPRRAWLGALAGLAVVAGAIGLLVVPPDRAPLYACGGSGEAVFGLVDDGAVTAAERVDGGVRLELDNWASDAEVRRVRARAASAGGVTRVSAAPCGARRPAG